MSKHRIFIAVAVSPRLQEEILMWERRYDRLPVRWLQGKNLHVTLIPPWYEERIDEVEKRLEMIREIYPFEILFEKVAYGPDPRRPRLIWAEGKVPKKLVDLKSKIETVLGKESEQRPFRLHLTLARFRPESFSQFSIKRLDEQVSWRDDARSFVLMESHRTPRGADYEILAEISLARKK